MANQNAKKFIYRVIYFNTAKKKTNGNGGFETIFTQAENRAEAIANFHGWMEKRNLAWDYIQAVQKDIIYNGKKA